LPGERSQDGSMVASSTSKIGMPSRIGYKRLQLAHFRAARSFTSVRGFLQTGQARRSRRSWEIIHEILIGNQPLVSSRWPQAALSDDQKTDDQRLFTVGFLLGSYGEEMTAVVLDGNKIAAEIRAEVTAEVAALAAAGIQPGLAVVLAGHNPASEIYVRGKVKSCEELGIYSEKHTPGDGVSTEALLDLVSELNRREEIDGILVQLPLPPQVDSKKVLMAVDPSKDVDGFHPMNVGLLSTQRPGLVPCTPAGVIEILKRSKIPIAGQEAVVVGRSDIVGKPVAMLLLNGNATVTVCHSKTRDLAEVCRRADILVAAIGRAGMITGDFVKPGATVIDVGMNKVTERAEFVRLFAGNSKREETFRAKGSVLVGDVHPEVAALAGAITPVPGGVGPLTIAMLMSNTVRAAKLRRGSFELARI